MELTVFSSRVYLPIGSCVTFPLLFSSFQRSVKLQKCHNLTKKNIGKTFWVKIVGLKKKYPVVDVKEELEAPSNQVQKLQSKVNSKTTKHEDKSLADIKDGSNTLESCSKSQSSEKDKEPQTPA